MFENEKLFLFTTAYNIAIRFKQSLKLDLKLKLTFRLLKLLLSLYIESD